MRYAFEGHTLDTDRRELWRGEALLAVEPLIFDILVLLIRNRERVVNKEDLRTGVWSGRVVSDSTLTSCMANVRAAVGDDGARQRLIRTVPRRGFRFVGDVSEVPEPAKYVDAGADAPVAKVSAVADAAPDQPLQADTDTAGRAANEVTSSARLRPTLALMVVGVVAVTMLIGSAAFWLVPFVSPGAPPLPTVRVFDAASVPIVSDAMRERLADYPQHAGAKALAIATDGLGLADGEPDEDSAKREALRICGTTAKRTCRIYAVGTRVVWSDAVMPLPARRDQRIEPLDARLVPDDLSFVLPDERRAIGQQFLAAPDHKALATVVTGEWYLIRQRSRSEATRRVTEQCATTFARPCLIISVDGFLTVQIPKAERITGIFLPSTDHGLPEPERERIAVTYQGQEWRALAQGRGGSWHAVAGASSEAAATEAALKACSQADRECHLYAVGNFRVAE